VHERRKLHNVCVSRTLPREAKQIIDDPLHAAGLANQSRELIAGLR
jgi:hypothetical protein